MAGLLPTQYPNQEAEDAARAANANTMRAFRNGQIDLTPVNEAFKAQPANRTQVGTIGGGPGRNAVVSPVFGVAKPSSFGDGTMDATPTAGARPAAVPAAPADPYAGTIYEGQGLPPGPDPTAPLQRLADQGLPRFFKAIGFNVDVPPDAAPAAAHGAPGAAPGTTVDYGNEHRRPTYGQRTVSPALAAQPAAAGGITSAQQAYNTPGAAYFGGKGKQYTPDQLAELAGPDNAEKVRSPMEIYANEAAINDYFAQRRQIMGGSGRGDPDAPLQTAQAMEAAGRTFQGRLAGNKAIFGQDARAAAQNLEVQSARSAQALRQKILAAKTPQEQRQHIDAYLALMGKKGGQNPIAVKGGQAIGPDGMTVFSQPESVFDPDTRQFIPNPGTGTPMPAAKPSVRSIEHLKKNPATAAEFDARYGQGAAQSILGK